MSRLNERAMLVTLNISSWKPSKVDKRASKEVADNHGSDANMGRYNKHLIDKSALEDVNRAATALREYHYSRTLPWSQDGPRILAAELYQEYTETIRKLKTDFSTAVDGFIGRYDSFVQDARYRLNGLFVESEYPRVSQLADKFGVELSIDPMPSSDDWRIKLGDDEEQSIREDIERRSKQAVNGAMQDAWQRLHDALNRAVETCNTDSPRFSDSMLGNLQDLVAVLPKMNIGGDPRLAELCTELSGRISGLTTEVLKTDSEQRDTLVSVAADAEAKTRSVLDDMAALYIGGAA